MYWPFKTTVKFATDGTASLNLEYLISANNRVAAKYEPERCPIGMRRSAT